MLTKYLKPFKWFIELFKPQNFEKQPYYWLLNQFGHIGLGVIFSWLIAPLFAFCFFLVWEVIQLYRSNDARDGIEDLTFETIGVLLFVFLSKTALLVALGILIFRLFNKYYNKV